MSYKLLAARRTPSGIAVKAEQEIIDTADSLEEARTLQKEYVIAYGETYAVWLEDPQGRDVDGCPTRKNFRAELPHPFSATPWNPEECQYCAQPSTHHNA